MKTRAHLFRDRAARDHSPVTYIELFFDLVFVFAITQLSHRLLSHLTTDGALKTILLFLPVWWVWIYTSWTTNWLDPERANVRLMLILMMLGGLALAIAIPDAFGGDGWLFSASYVAMQLFRSLYMVWASRGVNDARARNFLRISFYFVLSAPFWFWGAFVDANMRMYLWALAILIEYAGPMVFFRMPVLGRSTGADWDISGGHMAERCALFIIIALGEAVLVTGATYSALPHDGPTTAAFVASFVGSATLWWIYFDIGAKRASSMISGADNVGFIARNAYTYLHMPIVAGVVVTAVADAKMLAAPVAVSDRVYLLTACGGPILFLFGNQMFKWVTSEQRFPPLSHFIGNFLLAMIAVAGYFAHWETLTVGELATSSLIFTAQWEWFSLHGGWQRWAPWLGPLFGRKP
ncbi:MAG: low temperature requirement protein A [Sphingomonadales bacterium]|nr:low temperature requirement protein A [Sphingomonadales bacterium]